MNKELDRLRKYSAVEDELQKAIKKHPDYPTDMYKQVAILNEESGEVTKAVLHYHDEGGSLADVREELLQTAAMCMRMLNALDVKESNGTEKKSREISPRYFKCSRCGCITGPREKKPDYICVNMNPMRTSGLCGGSFTDELTKEEFNNNIRSYGI